MKNRIILVSACLLGLATKYNGRDNLNRKVLKLTKENILIPVCPEQLGGLPTPREPTEQKGPEIFTKSGQNVTRNFYQGSVEVLKIARLYDIKEAVFKQRSPSCGCGQIYDGTFSGKAIKGNGMTTALLKLYGIKIISEDEL